MNNQIWLMSSAYPALTLPRLIEEAKAVNVQGIELCVFRHEGTRLDHVATHVDYTSFGPKEAQELIDTFNNAGLRFSIGAYENLLGGDEAERKKNQDHLLCLIRMAHLLGGDENNVKVGTFTGYNHELGKEMNGFQKNLEEYQRIFTPIIKYAEDLGVTVMYENCPMEGWRHAEAPTTLNNLPCTLAARKLMYTLIPSRAHGETYDPSHDIWQHTDPVEVINQSDMSRIHRIHVKGTRNLPTAGRTHWGGMYPMFKVDDDLAAKAGVPTCQHEWDRHHYEAMVPGFGGSDSLDWRAFVDTVLQRGFEGPFVIENEAANSKNTGNAGAIRQGFQAGVLHLAPMLWELKPEKGYAIDPLPPLKPAATKDIPEVTVDKL